MFDSVLVAQTLIKNVLQGTDVVLQPFHGYYNFQTKDLDNCLTVFHLQEDGSFCYLLQQQEWVHVDPRDASSAWRAGYMKPIGEPEIIPDHRSTYFDFYDLYTTETERVFVTFTAHIKQGKLAEPIKLKNIERTDLEQEVLQTKKHRAEWNQIQSTWQWKLVCILRDTRNKISKLLYPLNRKLDNMEAYLSKQAKQGTSFDKNFRDQ